MTQDKFLPRRGPLTGLNLSPEPLPIKWDTCGVARVSDTKVSLQVVLGAYIYRSRKPEQIAEDFLLPLGDVYLVIGYYLRHKEGVDAYMEECRRRDETTRLELEAQGFTPADWQERLRARAKLRTRD